MQLKQLLTEERAVSPVIGVILMVAITVILAAVIGTFVLGLGQNVNSTPSASFGFDFEEGSSGSYWVNVTHEGGDTLSTDNSGNVSLVSDGSYSAQANWLEDSAPITAGDRCSFGDENAPNVDCATTGSGIYQLDPGATIRIIWKGSDGGSATLGSQKVPTS